MELIKKKKAIATLEKVAGEFFFLIGWTFDPDNCPVTKYPAETGRNSVN